MADNASDGEPTYTVSKVCGDIREVLTARFPDLWVSGEVQRLKASRAGHLYFELVEKGDDDEIVGKLDVAVWRTYNRRIQAELARAGTKLAEGQEIRCRGRVDFYEAGGRLQLAVREVDPTFTLGRLEMRRRETLEWLGKRGLLERNKSLQLPALPLEVALVTSAESAAYHDFLSTLRESPYGFRVVFVHAAVQGGAAERELASALAAAGRLDVDLIALVRGGGSRSDLAVFDSRRVAEAVAEAAHPVVTGLGHEIDRSVADLVAHSSVKTPTKVAELLIARVAEAERRVDRLVVELRHRALDHLRAARESLGRAERAVRMARLRTRAARQHWRHLAQRLGTAAERAVTARRTELTMTRRRLAATGPRFLRPRRVLPERIAERLAPAAARRLAAERRKMESYQRLCHSLSPQRVLRRGFSLTRDADGRVVRRAAGIEVGSRITTRLAEGEIASRVEATTRVEE